LAANIFETDEDIQNRINILSTAIPLALGETSPVKFGLVTLEISMWNHTPQIDFFGRPYFCPKGVLRPKFLHALENDKSY